jgi:hypothetical protein
LNRQSGFSARSSTTNLEHLLDLRPVALGFDTQGSNSLCR